MVNLAGKTAAIAAGKAVASGALFVVSVGLSRSANRNAGAFWKVVEKDGAKKFTELAGGFVKSKARELAGEATEMVRIRK